MPWTMNDAETWDALATGIERKRRIGPTWHGRWGSGRSDLGLCWAIKELVRHAGCPEERHVRLLYAVHCYAPHNRHSGYYWPLTPKGDRARARFCRRMANLAKADGGNHKA